VRWFEGDTGPHTDIAKAAPGRCGSCGFAVLLTGTLGHAFGELTIVADHHDRLVGRLDLEVHLAGEPDREHQHRIASTSTAVRT
jgi:hypothetical protein